MIDKFCTDCVHWIFGDEAECIYGECGCNERCIGMNKWEAE